MYVLTSRILKEMSKIVWNDEVQPSGNFFLQQLVKTSVCVFDLNDSVVQQ